MARSRKKGFVELLAAAPWWVSIVVALLVFSGCKTAPSLLHSSSPALAGVNVLTTLLAQYAHFFALPFVLLSGIAALNQFRRRKLLERQSGIEDIRNLSWQEFELLVGEAFRQEDFAVEENGGGGADGGVDLRLRRGGKTFLVQCKRWKQRQVPVTAVRELFGLMAAENADGAIFVSSGSFTPDAQRFADDNGVILIDGEELLALIGRPSSSTTAMTTRVEPSSIPSLEAAPVAAAGGDGAPPCPTCGGPMVRRTAKRGQNAGQAFWGCSSFPRCRGTLEGA